jgi:2-methylisocitrate lyase-like PEP mutase family enzyme
MTFDDLLTRVAQITDAVDVPVSVDIALPEQSDPASFGPLGVGRISFGPFLQAALTGRTQEILARWR